MVVPASPISFPILRTMKGLPVTNHYRPRSFGGRETQNHPWRLKSLFFFIKFEIAFTTKDKAVIRQVSIILAYSLGFNSMHLLWGSYIWLANIRTDFSAYAKTLNLAQILNPKWEHSLPNGLITLTKFWSLCIMLLWGLPNFYKSS